MACDEECTKQKAQDRLLAVINGLPDLMKPSSDDIDKSIQEIQSRTYSDDSDGTPTMNQNSSVNELLAATMEPPPLDPAQTFEGYQPSEIACKTQRAEPNEEGINGYGSDRKYVVGAWIIVDSGGKQVEGTGGSVCSCGVCGPGGSFYTEDGVRTQPRPNNYKYVFVNPASTWDEEQGVFVGNVASRCNASRGNKGCTYDFETGTYLDSEGNRWATNHPGKRVE
jgi:hypothetical protein